MEAGATRRPFLYSDGAMTILPLPPTYGIALGINDAGLIVGQMNPARGFLYSDGVVTDLNPILGIDWVAASGINDAGQIVGWAGETNGVFPSFLISHGVPRFLPMPTNAYYANAYEINNASQIVGDLGVFTSAPGEVNQQGVIWAHGTWRGLGTLPGGTYSAARAINEAGDVAGWSGLNYRGPTVANATHAYLHRDGRMIDLGAPRGAFSTYGHDLNDAGWVVGRSETLVGEVPRAFLYADGTMYDLNDLLKDPIDGALGSAEGVNERGQIVAWGYAGATLRGYLLTPQHEVKPKPHKSKPGAPGGQKSTSNN